MWCVVYQIDQKTDAIELLVTLLQAFRYCGMYVGVVGLVAGIFVSR